ncbi:MAG: hypothetical protein E7578_06170 [Ruminococcaceae bacterium]|nr:hypothetical protein [Oscillospiraceae bacterium]
MKLRMIGMFIATVLLFSVAASVSAYEVYFSEDFSSLEKFTSRFIGGAWCFYENEGICGGADAKALQTQIDDFRYGNYWPNYGYLTYDMTITLVAVDDPESENDRFVNLVYCNDNPCRAGLSDERIMMSFTYDFRNKCFRFTHGWNNTDPEYQFMEPVYIEISDDITEYYTLGMSVEHDRIRCFYNDTLVFDYKDTEGRYLISNSENSPFLFWQDGNCVHITNISVDRPGYLLEPSYLIGDANGDGGVDLSDVSLMMKYIAKWKELDINVYASDIGRDGKVTLADAAEVMRCIYAI